MENPIGFNFSPQPTLRQTLSQNKLALLSPQTPRTKRKRTPDDVDMDSSACSAVTQHAHSPSSKRTRNLPLGRPLPLARLLGDMDKPGLQDLVKNLCERNPGLSNEVYQYAPKPTGGQALATLAGLERNVQTSFPFGGDIKGEYAYNRVQPHIRELLNALMDYVPHFLPPNEEHALETLAFLDGATALISRLPDWHNINHSLAKREAYEEMNGAWIQGFKEASKRSSGVGAAPYLEKLRAWNDVSGGLLESAVQVAVEELGWVERGHAGTSYLETSHAHKTTPLYGLFSR